MKQRGFTIIEIAIAMVVFSAIVLMGLRLSEQSSVRMMVNHSVSQALLLQDAMDAYYYEECGFSSPSQPTMAIIQSDYLSRPFEWPAYVADVQLNIPSWRAGNSHSVITFVYENESIASRVDRNAQNSTLTSPNVVVFRRLFSSSNSSSAVRMQMDKEIYGSDRC